MRFDFERLDRGPAVALIAGIGIGATAGIYFGWKEWRRRRLERAALSSRFEGIETATVDALREDEEAGRRAIDVAAIGDGIIELTGKVENPEEARRAVDLAQRVEGVHTVVNRLAVGTVERHIVRTRHRFEAGDPALHETQWYGVGVGMGRRRQSRTTDPDRPDDRVRTISRVLEPSLSDETMSESATATENSSEEAGSEPASRRGSTGPTH